MVERRHRIRENEISEVVEGLKIRLWYHIHTRDSLTSATNAYTALFRLTNPSAGQPRYDDPITWDSIAIFLQSIEDNEAENTVSTKINPTLFDFLKGKGS